MTSLSTEREETMYMEIQRLIASYAHIAARVRKATASLLSCKDIRTNYTKERHKETAVLGVLEIQDA